MTIPASKIGLFAALFVAAALIAEPAAAQMVIKQNGQSLGTVANNVTNSLKGFSSLITMICYVGALVFGLIGAMKWKAYGEQPDRTPLKIPLTYWGIAVLLAAFPEFLGTGISTLFGSSGVSVVSEPI